MSDQSGIFRTIKERAAKALSDAGINDEAVLDEVSKQLQDKYSKRISQNKAELNTPRESTAPATIEQLAEAQNVLIDADGRRLGNYARQGNILSDLRGKNVDQNIRQYTATQDANTANDIAIINAFGAQKDAQRGHYGVMLDKNIDYKSGRDDKLFNYLSRGQDLDDRALTMDMITRLAGTAAVLFG